MNKFTFSLLTLFLCLAFSHCNKTEKEEITVSVDALPDFDAVGGTSQFTLTCKSSWTAASDQTWCTLNPAFGQAGTFTLTVTIDTDLNSEESSSVQMIATRANEPVMWRIARITIITNSDEKTITVRQLVQKLPEITMTTAMTGKITFDISGTGTVDIDWGDGSSLESLSFSPGMLACTHHYSGTSPHTIKIYGNHCTFLLLSDAQLTSLDVIQYRDLLFLSCEDNQLIHLNVTECPAMWYLCCFNNQLPTFTVSNCKALEKFICSDNQLTSFEMKGCPALKEFACQNNHLTEIILSGYTKLEGFYCMDNKLTTLDVSGCTALSELWCFNNQLNDTELNTIFSSLPAGAGAMYIANNPGTDACNPALASTWDVFAKYPWEVE